MMPFEEELQVALHVVGLAGQAILEDYARFEVVPDAPAKVLHCLGQERLHAPSAFAPAHLVQEVAEDEAALGRMANLRMEL